MGQLSGVSCNTLTQKNTIIFANFDNGIYKSTNNGLNWMLSYSTPVKVLISNDSAVFGGNYYGVIKSTDYGTTWQQTSLNNAFVWSMSTAGNKIYAGCVNPPGSFGVYKSFDNGMTWYLPNLTDIQVTSLVSSGAFVAASTGNPGRVYVSSNYGFNWSQTLYPAESSIDCMAIKDSIIIAGGTSKVFISTNYGINWHISLIPNVVPLSIFINDGSIFVGTNYGFFLSTNYGLSWISKNEGLENLNYQYINAICVNANYVFIGTFLYGVWRRPLNEVIGITQNFYNLPKFFSLSQNYPNPFNPVTNIKFDIPKSSLVKITVYDQLGREVATLVNEQMQAGSYSVDWDASNFSSGVYFYRIETEDFSKTNKMVLVK